MKILITGSNGQLGWELCQRKSQYDKDSFACDLPLFDLTDKDNIIQTIDTVKPDIIINAAAYTAVDPAEKDPETAFKVNRDGVGYLADACKAAAIPLIHISTDYVFDGTKDAAYKETDPISPIGIYGKSKAQGEELLRQTWPNHIILRTAWLYSVHGNNFIKTMLRVGKQNEQLRVVDDQYGCPTSASDLADAILTIADGILNKHMKTWGTYHYSNSGKTTWFKFAQKIFEFAAPYDTFALKQLHPITTEAYPTPAKRPANSVLDCTLISETFSIELIPWESSLEKIIKQLYTGKNNSNE